MWSKNPQSYLLQCAKIFSSDWLLIKPSLLKFYKSASWSETLRRCLWESRRKWASEASSSPEARRRDSLWRGRATAGGSILLLDDPLSAVDAPVARRIFQQCIRGYLKDKAVVLVSHQLAYLAQCDTLLYLEEGR